MNIREAILKAADHIEANPHLYDFYRTHVPPEDGDCPACMWGRIGYFLEMYGQCNVKVARVVAGKTIIEHMVPTAILYDFDSGLKDYSDAKDVAKHMRAYANAHHPEEKPRAVYRNGADIVKDILRVAA